MVDRRRRFTPRIVAGSEVRYALPPELLPPGEIEQAPPYRAEWMYAEHYARLRRRRARRWTVALVAVALGLAAAFYGNLIAQL